MISPRPRLMADSRSTGRLQSSNAHRSMTRLNAGKSKFNMSYILLQACSSIDKIN